jgi:methylaspartate mutase sigma subunit
MRGNDLSVMMDSEVDNHGAEQRLLTRMPSRGTDARRRRFDSNGGPNIALNALVELAPAVASAELSVVLAVPGDDVHVLGVKVAEVLLRATNYDVHNLGVTASVAEIVAAVEAHRPSALILTTVNGHAYTNCKDIPRALRDRGSEVPIYIGGKLAVGREAWAVTRRRFAACGLANAFEPTVELPEGLLAITKALLLEGGRERRARELVDAT